MQEPVCPAGAEYKTDPDPPARTRVRAAAAAAPATAARRRLNGNAKLSGTIPSFPAPAASIASASLAASSTSSVTVYVEGTAITCAGDNVATIPALPSCTGATPTPTPKPSSSSGGDEKTSTSQKEDPAPDPVGGLSNAGLIAIAVIVPIFCIVILTGAGVLYFHNRKKKAAVGSAMIVQ